MTVSPINITRVSNNLRTNLTADSVRRSQRDLLLTQTRIATGRSFVSPSEDPVAAGRALDLTQALGRQQQFSANLQYADNTLAAADSALNEIAGLVTEAQTLASQNVSNLTSAAERAADAQLIAGIRGQLQNVGNRQFNGRFLFAGRDTLDRPFVDSLGGIAYAGDTGDLLTRIEESTAASVNVPGNVLFGALSSRIAAAVDLSPSLTAETRLEDLGGASGHGIRAGNLIFSESGGADVMNVDLSGVDTIGDVVARINQAASTAGSTLTASLSADGLEVSPGRFPLSITDPSGGVVGADLGILTAAPTTDLIVGRGLVPRLTRLTPIDALASGAGIDLDGGLVITNGVATATVDLSLALTVQDIVNSLNNAEVSVLARINDAGTGIDVYNRTSGTSLTIGENGGTTATDLGIRTLSRATPLATLNFGNGVTMAAGGDDLRIIAKNGQTVNVNLNAAVTVGDVIDLMNEAARTAGVAVLASLAVDGNGIRVSDTTGGTGAISVADMNESTAASDLGLAQLVSGTAVEFIGEDRSGIRTEGVLGALVDLEHALLRDDTRGITAAAERMETFVQEVTHEHGLVGARSQAMRAKLFQMGDAARTTEIFLSQVQDLDYAEAVTRLQASQTQLQANLQTSSTLLNLSLIDFLR